MARATGLARNTIKSGILEIEHRTAFPDEIVEQRIRRTGGGRKGLSETDPQLLEALVDPVTRGDLESPLRWTCKSTAKLANELARQDHLVTDRTVAMLLKDAGYSLQAFARTTAGIGLRAVVEGAQSVCRRGVKALKRSRKMNPYGIICCSRSLAMSRSARSKC